MLFGDRIRKMRENAGLTQAELGKLIGVSDRVLGYYEANVRFPNKPETLLELSEVFKVSVDFLLGNDEKSVDGRLEIISKQAKDLLNKVYILFTSGNLTDEERDEFFRLVTVMYFDAKRHICSAN